MQPNSRLHASVALLEYLCAHGFNNLLWLNNLQSCSLLAVSMETQITMLVPSKTTHELNPRKYHLIFITRILHKIYQLNRSDNRFFTIETIAIKSILENFFTTLD